MRMRFDADDETASYDRRNELCDQFARWLETHRVAGEPGDANLLMDWKFGYGDGELDTWTTADVGEFLFRWCPRKLSAPQKYLMKVPRSGGGVRGVPRPHGHVGAGQRQAVRHSPLLRAQRGPVPAGDALPAARR